MSEYQFKGAFKTPLESCDATTVKYIDKQYRTTFSRLNLINGGKGDASIRTFADCNGGAVFNHKDRTYAVWFDDYKDGRELTEAQKRKLKVEMEAARRQAEAEERAQHARKPPNAMEF